MQCTYRREWRVSIYSYAGVQARLASIAQDESQISSACLAFFKASIAAVPALLLGFVFQEGKTVASPSCIQKCPR